MREEKHPIIVNQSMFVPHIIVPNVRPAAAEDKKATPADETPKP